MADYKRYITQIQENGSVMISEDVVAAIAEHALNDWKALLCCVISRTGTRASRS